jgi:hypothetical protein
MMNTKANLGVAIGLIAALASSSAARADLKTKGVRGAAQVVARLLGKEVAKEGAANMAARIEALAGRYGEEVLVAVDKVGPAAVPALEQAGEHAPQAAKLLAKYGERGVALICRPRPLALIARYGDEAAQVMLKHPGIAESLLEVYGRPAIKALQSLGGRQGRSLARLWEQGGLRTLGRTEELLAVIGRYGDRAMEFIWRHKKSLTIAAVLAAFLADPEPFITDAKDLGKVTVEQVAGAAVRPLAEGTGKVVQEAARRVNWTLIVGGGMVLVVGWWLVKIRQTYVSRH